MFEIIKIDELKNELNKLENFTQDNNSEDNSSDISDSIDSIIKKNILEKDATNINSDRNSDIVFFTQNDHSFPNSQD